MKKLLTNTSLSVSLIYFGYPVHKLESLKKPSQSKVLSLNLQVNQITYKKKLTWRWENMPVVDPLGTATSEFIFIQEKISWNVMPKAKTALLELSRYVLICFDICCVHVRKLL